MEKWENAHNPDATATGTRTSICYNLTSTRHMETHNMSLGFHLCIGSPGDHIGRHQVKGWSAAYPATSLSYSGLLMLTLPHWQQALTCSNQLSIASLPTLLSSFLEMSPARAGWCCPCRCNCLYSLTFLDCIRLHPQVSRVVPCTSLRPVWHTSPNYACDNRPKITYFYMIYVYMYINIYIYTLALDYWL